LFNGTLFSQAVSNFITHNTALSTRLKFCCW